MNSTRRQFLQFAARWAGSLGALSLLRPLAVFAGERNGAAFEAKSVADVVKAYGGEAAAESGEIVLTIPEIAENGAVVPVSVESRLAGTRSIAILVEKNPSVLAARFEMPEGTQASVSTRVKVAETSDIIALVQTDDGFFRAQKQVKVTLGGCGG